MHRRAYIILKLIDGIPLMIGLGNLFLLSVIVKISDKFDQISFFTVFCLLNFRKRVDFGFGISLKLNKQLRDSQVAAVPNTLFIFIHSQV